MRCPPIWWCPVCYRIVIHRGKRSHHESASYLGQIVHGLLPRQPAPFWWGDVDGALWRRSLRLLRDIEHKPPGQRPDGGQDEFLKLRARMTEHLKTCPAARQEFGLHPKSGVFLIQGDPHEGNQLGPCTIENIHTGEIWTPKSEEDALCWIALLDGGDRLTVRHKLAVRRSQPPLGTPEKIAHALLSYMAPDDLAVVAKLLTEALGDAA